MRRASTLILILAFASPAVADDEPHPEVAEHHETSAAQPADPRTALGELITAQAQAIERTLATVSDKLHAADAMRVRRIRAAYRILHAPLASEASPDDRMVSARRRAAARLLIDRDAAERGLLASEADLLRTAQTRTAEAATQLPMITLPVDLGWPAKGKVVRHFGVFEHERSRATLSRRGLDIEVDEHAAANAPADGIVRYAGVMRGLDHGVILDHGDYMTVVAKLGEVAIPVGAHVTRGDRLGRAMRHRVYLEVRVKIGPGGLPIDPEPLLSR